MDEEMNNTLRSFLYELFLRVKEPERVVVEIRAGACSGVDGMMWKKGVGHWLVCLRNRKAHGWSFSGTIWRGESKMYDESFDVRYLGRTRATLPMVRARKASKALNEHSWFEQFGDVPCLNSYEVFVGDLLNKEG